MLIEVLESDSILPQDHYTISNFTSASFMRQITSILGKIRKVRSKRQKYLMHRILLWNPVQIRSKDTAQFYDLYLYGCEYLDYYKSPVHFRPNTLYLYGHDYRISVYQLRCKHHQKIPPHVTPLRHTTLHMKIHLCELAHKSPQIKPVIWLLLNFLHVDIINTQTRKPSIWISLHFLYAYIISTQTQFFPSFK